MMKIVEIIVSPTAVYVNQAVGATKISGGRGSERTGEL